MSNVLIIHKYFQFSSKKKKKIMLLYTLFWFSSGYKFEDYVYFMIGKIK